MKTPRQANYWIGWGFAFGLLAAGFVWAAWQASTMEWCGPSNVDQNCGREWMSALGAWAAVPAAVGSVMYLARQIAESRTQHRSMLRVQFQPNRSLARLIQRELQVDAWFLTFASTPKDYAESLEELERKLALPVIDHFEQNIGNPLGSSILVARKLLSTAAKQALAYSRLHPTRQAPDLEKAVMKTCEDAESYAQGYLQSLLAVAKGYLDDTDATLGA